MLLTRWKIHMFKITKPTLCWYARNSLMIGLRCLVVKALKDSPKVRSEITSKKRSMSGLLTSINESFADLVDSISMSVL